MLWQRLPEPSYTATLAVRSKASGLFCLGCFFFQVLPAFSKLQSLASILDSLVTVC